MARETWTAEATPRSAWRLLRFYRGPADEEALNALLAALTAGGGLSEFFRADGPDSALALVVRKYLVTLLVESFNTSVGHASTIADDAQAMAKLSHWLCLGQRNVHGDVLHFLLTTEWPSGTSAAVQHTGLFASLRKCVDRLMQLLGTATSPVAYLEGAFQLAMGNIAAGGGNSGSNSAWVSFAFELLSLPHLIARLLSHEAAQFLVNQVCSPANFEACTLALDQVQDFNLVPRAGQHCLAAQPQFPGAAWLLGNLVQANINLGEPTTVYIQVLGKLIKQLPKGALQAEVREREESDEEEDKPARANPGNRLPKELQTEIMAIAGEGHLRSTLITTVRAIDVSSQRDISESSQAMTDGAVYSLLGEADALACCKIYAELANALPTNSSFRLLHTIASPTYRILAPLWSWVEGSLEMQCLLQGDCMGNEAIPVLDLFCRAFNRRLLLLDDDEFYEKKSLLPLEQVRAIIAVLKRFLVQVYWTAPNVGTHSLLEATGPAARSAARLLRDLHQKNSRREFAPASEWVVDEIPASCFSDMTGATDPRLIPLLRDLPHFIPFDFRATLFTHGVEADMALQPHRENWAQYQRVTIRRNWEVEDGFDQLNHLGAEGALRGHVRIKYIDEHGLEEAGIDGGGLFKEFLTNVVRAGFNPDFGLFKFTPDKALYPNPASEMSGPGELHLHYIAFLGRMIGKALYEGILVELPLASFFLNKLLGRPNQVGDLYSLDPELARHLMSIKEYATNDIIEDLELYFVMTEEFGLGQKREVELMPGGKDRKVTKANHIEYIYCVADFYLNRQTSRQCRAFLRGFQDVIKPEWLNMFSSSELQLLISGTEDVLDVQDFQAHTNYSGEFNAEHPTIQNFWLVVSEMSNEDRSKLLRFVTSCSRPPLLGFKQLQPAFCIHFGGPGDSERLPSASTCINLLKLPAYATLPMLREKLMQAITQGTGFGLS